MKAILKTNLLLSFALGLIVVLFNEELWMKAFGLLTILSVALFIKKEVLD